MMRVEHLTQEQLAGVLKDPRQASVWVEHISHCDDCRRQLAGLLLLERLVRPGQPVDEGHLSSADIDRTHAHAFEFEKPTRKEANDYLRFLHHMNVCDDCHAKFLSRHQSLAPSDGAMTGALAKFRQGQSRRHVGRLIISGTLDRLRQVFVPSMALLDPIGGMAPEASGTSEVSEPRGGGVPVLGAVAGLAAFSKVFRGREWPSPPQSLALTYGAGKVSTRAASVEDAIGEVARTGERMAHLARLVADNADALRRLQKVLVAASHGSDVQLLQEAQSLLAMINEQVAAQHDLLQETAAHHSAVRHDVEQFIEEQLHELAGQAPSRPESIEMPGLLVSIATSWNGKSGHFKIDVLDQYSGKPRPSVTVTTLRQGRGLGASVISDASGRVLLPVDATVTGVEFRIGATDKPSVMEVDLH